MTLISAGPVCGEQVSPAIPDLYDRFKDYAGRNIDRDVGEPGLDPRTEALVEEVLEEYGPLDARRLEYLARREEPWLEARGDLPMEEQSEAIISEDTMRTFYRARLSQQELADFRQDLIEAAGELTSARKE